MLTWVGATEAGASGSRCPSQEPQPLLEPFPMVFWVFWFLRGFLSKLPLLFCCLLSYCRVVTVVIDLSSIRITALCLCCPLPSEKQWLKLTGSMINMCSKTAWLLGFVLIFLCISLAHAPIFNYYYFKNILWVLVNSIDLYSISCAQVIKILLHTYRVAMRNTIFVKFFLLLLRRDLS